MSVWITLDDAHLQFCNKIAVRRQQNAERNNLPAGNGAPAKGDVALTLNLAGVPGEAAAKLYLNPIKWNAYRDGANFTEADLDTWIDVKTVAKMRHCLIIQRDDSDDWAYLLVCSEQKPRYCLIGWVWGREAKQERFWSDPVGGRPAYFVKPDDAIMRHPSGLLERVQWKRLVPPSS